MLVVWEGGRLAFERLQQRLARGRDVGALAAAATWPDHLVVFDVLRLKGADLTSWPGFVVSNELVHGRR